MTTRILLIFAGFYSTALHAQTIVHSTGYYTTRLDPNLMGYEGLYCGTMPFTPFPLSYDEKMRIPYLEAAKKTNSTVDDDFSAVYADSRNIVHSTRHSHGTISSIRFSLYEGYRKKPTEELVISISKSGGIFKKRSTKPGVEDIALFSFFTNEENDINQVELYATKGFPKENCSAIVFNDKIYLNNDTIQLNIIEGQNQVITTDRKKRPVDFWIYDDQNRLVQYRHYQYTDIGFMRIDSTSFKWKDDKVIKISSHKDHTICTYDSTGLISRIENYTSNKLISRYEYTYTYDLRNNWNSFVLSEVNIARNSKTRKYFVKREITYRE
ncbi:MAG TPA: hypothetical protein VK177_00635 [Flavobacteriales bacterium]|nr:hypothetical protein [Flavobacteriales bacterium]